MSARYKIVWDNFVFEFDFLIFRIILISAVGNYLGLWGFNKVPTAINF